jgi:hypothetical protein
VGLAAATSLYRLLREGREVFSIGTTLNGRFLQHLGASVALFRGELGATPLFSPGAMPERLKDLPEMGRRTGVGYFGVITFAASLTPSESL